MRIRPMLWEGDHLRLLDQRLLPQSELWLELRSWQQVEQAVRDMAVRGAPAIGIAAGYGMALAALRGEDRGVALAGLAGSRPTAVNLFWALRRFEAVPWTAEDALALAQAIEREELERCLEIGRLGAAKLHKNARILTVCNTGGLATAGFGTALGIIQHAHESGLEPFVTSCETRPRLQGLRLTAWELKKLGIPFRSIVDGAAAALMAAGEVDYVIAGADRIARNGDTANKIGTYSLAVLAKHHDIPFMIAAPSSTIDPALEHGDEIPIEERDASEITAIGGEQIAPDGTPVWNPAFDVTPGELICSIVTEHGVFSGPYGFRQALAASR